MDDQRSERLADHPQFRELVSTRNKFAVTLSIVMLAIYYGFILIIAFVPDLLGTPIGGGVTTIGIPIGLAVIVSAFVLTGIYVSKANTTFDRLTDKLIREVK